MQLNQSIHAQSSKQNPYTDKFARFMGGLPEQVSGVFLPKLHCQHDLA